MLKEWSFSRAANTAPTRRPPAGRQRRVPRAFLHAPPQSPTPWSGDRRARSIQDRALCRLSHCVDKLPEIMVLGEGNPALALGDVDDGVSFCARGQTSRCIHPFGSTSAGVALTPTLSPLLRPFPRWAPAGERGLTFNSSRYFTPPCPSPRGIARWRRLQTPNVRPNAGWGRGAACASNKATQMD
jgi:hypothetical protein